MKQVKKRTGRAISILLAVMMLVTSVPQSAMTASATEVTEVSETETQRIEVTTTVATEATTEVTTKVETKVETEPATEKVTVETVEAETENTDNDAESELETQTAQTDETEEPATQEITEELETDADNTSNADIAEQAENTVTFSFSGEHFTLTDNAGNPITELTAKVGSTESIDFTIVPDEGYTIRRVRAQNTRTIRLIGTTKGIYMINPYSTKDGYTKGETIDITMTEINDNIPLDFTYPSDEIAEIIVTNGANTTTVQESRVIISNTAFVSFRLKMKDGVQKNPTVAWKTAGSDESEYLDYDEIDEQGYYCYSAGKLFADTQITVTTKETFKMKFAYDTEQATITILRTMQDGWLEEVALDGDNTTLIDQGAPLKFRVEKTDRYSIYTVDISTDPQTDATLCYDDMIGTTYYSIVPTADTKISVRAVPRIIALTDTENAIKELRITGDTEGDITLAQDQKSMEVRTSTGADLRFKLADSMKLTDMYYVYNGWESKDNEEDDSTVYERVSYKTELSASIDGEGFYRTNFYLDGSEDITEIVFVTETSAEEKPDDKESGDKKPEEATTTERVVAWDVTGGGRTQITPLKPNGTYQRLVKGHDYEIAVVCGKDRVPIVDWRIMGLKSSTAEFSESVVKIHIGADETKTGYTLYLKTEKGLLPSIKLQIVDEMKSVEVVRVKNGVLDMIVDRKIICGMTVYGDIDSRGRKQKIRYPDFSEIGMEVAMSENVPKDTVTIALETTGPYNQNGYFTITAGARAPIGKVATVKLYRKKLQPTDGNYYIDGGTFVLNIVEPTVLKEFTPTVTQKTCDDTSITLELSGADNVGNCLQGGQYYKIVVTPKGENIPDSIKEATKNTYFIEREFPEYDDEDFDEEAQPDPFIQKTRLIVNNAGIGKGQAWNYDVKVTLIQTYDRTVAPTEANLAQQTAYTSRERAVSANTKDASFAKTIKLKKGTTKIYTTQTKVATATVTLDQNTVCVDCEAVDITDCPNSQKLTAKVEDGQVLVDAPKGTKLGKHTLLVMPVGPETMYRPSAKLDITVIKGIEKLSINLPTTKIYKPKGKAGSLKATIDYNAGDVVANTKKVSWSIVDEYGDATEISADSNDDSENAKPAKKVTIKNGTITVPKELNAEDTDYTFCIKATAEDFKGNKTSAISKVITITSTIEEPTALRLAVKKDAETILNDYTKAGYAQDETTAGFSGTVNTRLTVNVILQTKDNPSWSALSDYGYAKHSVSIKGGKILTSDVGNGVYTIVVTDKSAVLTLQDKTNKTKQSYTITNTAYSTEKGLKVSVKKGTDKALAVGDLNAETGHDMTYSLTGNASYSGKYVIVEPDAVSEQKNASAYYALQTACSSNNMRIGAPIAIGADNTVKLTFKNTASIPTGSYKLTFTVGKVENNIFTAEIKPVTITLKATNPKNAKVSYALSAKKYTLPAQPGASAELVGKGKNFESVTFTLLGQNKNGLENKFMQYFELKDGNKLTLKADLTAEQIASAKANKEDCIGYVKATITYKDAYGNTRNDAENIIQITVILQ